MQKQLRAHPWPRPAVSLPPSRSFRALPTTNTSTFQILDLNLPEAQQALQVRWRCIVLPPAVLLRVDGGTLVPAQCTMARPRDRGVYGHDLWCTWMGCPSVTRLPCIRWDVPLALLFESAAVGSCVRGQGP